MTLNREMALRVVWGTRLDDNTPAPDARELLEMCGLVEPGGHVIAPDITGGIRVPTNGGSIGGNTDEPPLRRTPEDPPPRNVTTPPGLRVLPALAPAAATPPKAAPKQKATPKAPRPGQAKPAAAPRERKLAECGSTGGYHRHVRLKEEICRPCRDAKNTYHREHNADLRDRAAGRPARPSRRKVAVCGTRSGYARHKRLREPVCEPCLASNRKRRVDPPANSEEARLLAAGVNPDAAAILAAGPTPTAAAPPKPTALPAKRLTPVLTPIDHGTAEGWQQHHDRGALPPCGDCKTAVAPPPAPVPIKPDDWLAAAQRSPHRAVARAAAIAIGIRVRIEAATTAQLADGRLLARLDAALDDVARAQARASSRTNGATA